MRRPVLCALQHGAIIFAVQQAAILCATQQTARAGADYAPDSADWNGLGSLVSEARAAGCPVVPTDALDWSALDAHDVLWFVYPRARVAGDTLRRYLAAGGRAVIADDFGAAAPALESLEIRRSTLAGALDGADRYHKNPQLPVAKVTLATDIARSAELVANHPAYFESAIPATYAFVPGAALVVEGKVGRGYFVAIADPSVLINNMLEIDGNRTFARALIARTCRPHEDRILLVTQTFSEHGEPNPSALNPPDPTSPFARFNNMLGSFNSAVRAFTSDGRGLSALACAMAVVALLVLAGGFPATRVIDGEWTRVRRLLAHGEPAAIERAAWDHSLPAAILRREVEERLAGALGGEVAFGRIGPQALARRVAADYGPVAARDAAELWRLLHRVRWREGSDAELAPESRVSRRQLTRMHALAISLFDALAERQPEVPT
jgi:hypothetical protein